MQSKRFFPAHHDKLALSMVETSIKLFIWTADLSSAVFFLEVRVFIFGGLQEKIFCSNHMCMLYVRFLWAKIM